jgi:hypothetical protein
LGRESGMRGIDAIVALGWWWRSTRSQPIQPKPVKHKLSEHELIHYCEDEEWGTHVADDNKEAVWSNHAASDFGWWNLRLVDGYSHVHHANADTVEETADQKHAYVNRSSLESSRNDTNEGSDLNGSTTSSGIKQPGNQNASNDSATCKETIVG